MAFDFKAIPEKKVDVDYEFKGQTLKAVVDANKITQNVANSNDYALALSMFIDSWDASDELSVDFLRKLPMEFLIGFFWACQTAAFPKAMTAGR